LIEAPFDARFAAGQFSFLMDENFDYIFCFASFAMVTF
jgi:hypothetical protein